MRDVIPFPGKAVRKPLPIKSVETIGFLTTDDRDIYISDKADIAKVMSFIIKEKIGLKEE